MRGHCHRPGLAALTLCTVGACAEPPRLDDQVLSRYGGVYLADCADAASARAEVFADSLVLQGGGQRLAGLRPQPAHSWFGNSPPEGFALALLATAPQGREMTWLVFDGPGGRHLLIGDGGLEGAAPTGMTLSRCDTLRTGTTAPDPPERPYTLDELSASGLLNDDAARAAYYAVLGALRDEPWLADLDGPSPQNRMVDVAGGKYLLACACKNHDCYDNSVVLLYAAAEGEMFGMVYQSGDSTLLGTPPPALARELPRLWQEEFRQDPR